MNNFEVGFSCTCKRIQPRKERKAISLSSSDADWYNNYVDSSAEYCRALFACAAKFFLANESVEQIVVTGGGRKFIELFSECSSIATECSACLAEFQQLHEAGSSPLEIDFKAQRSRLELISENCSEISRRFSKEDPEGALQEQIWGDDLYTSLFISTARHLTRSIEWQCEFAERANLDSEEGAAEGK